MKSYFNATCKATVIGDGTVGALVAWLEKYVNVLFPENGIEYFGDNRYRRGQFLRREDRVPGAGLTNDGVHHVACYVRTGSNEGRIIEVALYLRADVFLSLAWIKSFGSADECWAIARAIDAALNSILFWGEVPELVAMSDKVPREYAWYRQTSLTEEVTILSGLDKVLVSTASGLVLDDRSWEGQVHAGSNAAAVATDWVTVLTNSKASFKVVKDVPDRLAVPDLPGYAISKRGVDVEGYYILPPGGNPNDDRDYLGYFPDRDAAIAAAREHKVRQLAAAA